MIYQRYIKRCLDFVLSLLAIICFTPIIVIVATLLYICNKGNNVLFIQERPGKYGKIFKVYKFKTMNDNCDNNGKLLCDSQRTTKIGKFLRSTSIDELPQLFNIIKGDMSFIGPRPLLIQYLPLYSKEQSRRHNVTPGITGWAQINGRNAISWKQKFEYDVYYVDNCSFSLDLRITLITIKQLLTHSDISQHALVSAEPFNGNE